MKKTIILLLFLVVIVFAALNTVSAAQTTERASITDSEPNDGSYEAAITPDGRYIAFASEADNLVSGDSNGAEDVFVKDGWTGSITRVSTTSTGAQSTGGGSWDPSITPDGRYVAFTSVANNLVSGDTNGKEDVFVKDGWTGAITRVSTTSTGAQATGGPYGSYSPSMTPDARYVVFCSDASNLVAGDTNNVVDVFVKDGWTGAITRVSTSAGGTQADDESYSPSITPNGRYIAFTSEATNLISGDTNVANDIFVKDGWTGAITRVSTSATGAQADDSSYNPVITPDGRYIAFESGAGNLVGGDTADNMDVFVKDGWTGAITRVSTTSLGAQATGGDSWYPKISQDGRYITFLTHATNLVNPLDNNGYSDIYLKDGWTGTVTRVSINANGGPTDDHSNCPVITPDGRYVVYFSYASGIVNGDLNDFSDVFVYDRLNNRNVRISTSKIAGSESNSDSYDAAITPDGRYIAFDSLASNLVADDTNGHQDIFVHDKVTNQTIRASTTSTGAQATDGDSRHPSITPDGRYVTFYSWASNLVTGDTNGLSDVFVKDMLTGQITRVSTTASNGQSMNGNSYHPVITSDGRYIAFMSGATNLVPGDTNGYMDVFVKDGWYGTITRVSTSASGAQGDYESWSPSITPNGRYIAFESVATNLVSGDTNGAKDIFVKDGWTGQITRVSTAANGAQATGGNSLNVVITPDGRYIAFESEATNLVAGDTNGKSDIFVKDGWTGAITRISTTSTGAQATGGNSYHVSITPDGHYIAFSSDATNLVSGDTNGYRDVFVKDGWTGQTTRVSTTSSGGQAVGSNYDPVITSDGRYVAFESDANLLGFFITIPLDGNSSSDIYVKGLW